MVIPLSFLILNAFICSFIIIVRLFNRLTVFKPVRHLVRRDTIIMSHGTRSSLRSKMLYILSIQFMLGLPWVSKLLLNDLFKEF